MRISFAVAALASGLALACGTSEVTGESEGAVGKPILGQEWIRCSFANGAGNSRPFSCTTTEAVENAPQVSIDVKLENPAEDFEDGDGYSNERVKTSVIASVSADKFPLSLTVHVSLDNAEDMGIGRGDFIAKKVISSASELSSGSPFIVRQPFAVWPVRILNLGKTSLAYTTRYQTSIAPLQDTFGDSEIEISKQFDTDPGDVVTAFVAAPKGNNFSLKEAQSAIGAQPKVFKVTGPVDLIVDEKGIRLARSGEIPADGAQGNGNNDQDNDNNNAVEGKPCGNDGEPGCAGAKRCEDGLTYGADYLCHPCGNEGEARCQKSGGGYSCNEGFSFVASDKLCHSCGGDGQPKCLLGDGTYACNGDTTYAPADKLCHSCGREDQVRCQVNGLYSCEGGFVYDATVKLCKSCGKDGEPRCLNNGTYECDSDFVYDTTTRLCKPKPVKPE